MGKNGGLVKGILQFPLRLFIKLKKGVTTWKALIKAGG